jgi:hypothetical protein
VDADAFTALVTPVRAEIHAHLPCSPAGRAASCRPAPTRSGPPLHGSHQYCPVFTDWNRLISMPGCPWLESVENGEHFSEPPMVAMAYSKSVMIAGDISGTGRSWRELTGHG